MEMPPPGWYEDPVAAGGPLRWWDGTQWTEHTAPTGSTALAANERAPGITERAARAIEGAVGRDHPAASSTTRVLDRAGPGTLAEFGWRHSTPVSEDDTPLLERGEAAGRLRRNRTRLMWGLALGAAVAMLITGVLVAVFGWSTAPHAAPAAAAGHPSAVRTLTPKASAPPPSTPSAVPTTGTPVTDPASGLSVLRDPRHSLAAQLPGRDEQRGVHLDGRGERGGPWSQES